MTYNTITALGFQGGGVKIIACIGALKRLLHDGLNITNIKHFAGTSAGSQVATLLACGYTIEEIETILYNMPLKYCKDGSFGFMRNSYRLLTNFGYYKGEFIESFMEKLIFKKLLKRNASFRDLYNYNKNILRITGTCLTTSSLEYFDKDLTPDMPISKAVHISSCIPIFYAAVNYNGKYYVDGGVLRNLPIMAFPNDEILFIEFIHNKEIFKINNLYSFILSLINVTVDYSNQLAVEKGVEKLKNVHFIKIDTGNISSIDFDIDDSTKTFLLNQGWNSVV